MSYLKYFNSVILVLYVSHTTKTAPGDECSFICITHSMKQLNNNISFQKNVLVTQDLLTLVSTCNIFESLNKSLVSFGSLPFHAGQVAYTLLV